MDHDNGNVDHFEGDPHYYEAYQQSGDRIEDCCDYKDRRKLLIREPVKFAGCKIFPDGVKEVIVDGAAECHGSDHHKGKRLEAIDHGGAAGVLDLLRLLIVLIIVEFVDQFLSSLPW